MNLLGLTCERVDPAKSIELLDLEDCDPELFDHLVRSRELTVTFNGRVVSFSRFDAGLDVISEYGSSTLASDTRTYVADVLKCDRKLISWDKLITFGYNPITKELIASEGYSDITAFKTVSSKCIVHWKLTVDPNERGKGIFHAKYGLGKVATPINLLTLCP